jgi:two-component system, LytTR family, response regulator
MNHNYIIIEDQKGALENLQIALEPYNNLLFKGTATNIKEGLSLCLKQKPNLIFLDVELGLEIGFDLINELRSFYTTLPFIIMTTAHDHYAKQAVNNDVLYFLSKPVDNDELQKALTKFEKAQSEQRNHLVIKDKNGHTLMQYNDIVYIEAQSNYCVIYLKHGKKNTVSKTLKDIESLLPNTFLRTHKSFMVNTQFVEKINTTKKQITLNTKTGIIEIVTDTKTKVDENLQLKETETTIPIGESYIELVKNSLFVYKTI